MLTPDGPGADGRRSRQSWRERLTGPLIGLAAGMAVNDLSGTLGYRGLAGVAALAAVLTVSGWIRRLDTRAWLPRYAKRIFLAPAFVAAAVASVSTGESAGFLAAAAVVLTVGAVLVTGSIEGAADLLLGAVLGALGLAAVVEGIAFWPDLFTVVAFEVVALVCIVWGAGVVLDHGRVCAVAAVVAPPALALLCVADLPTLGVLTAAALAVTGVAAGLMIAGWRPRRRWAGVAVVLPAGLLAGWVSVRDIAGGQWVRAVVIDVFGLAAVGVLAALASGRLVLGLAAQAAMGLLAAAVGADLAATGDVFPGVVSIGFALATAGGVIVAVGPGTVASAVRRLAASVTKPPDRDKG